MRFNSSWAMETGVQVTWDKQVYNSSFYGSSTTIKLSAWIVPLLARYTFKASESRLHVDALGGISLLYGRSEVEYAYYGVSNGYRTSNAELGLVLGPQLRCTLASALDLKLNLPFNVRVTGNGDFSDRLFLTPQLGVQYAFGQ